MNATQPILADRIEATISAASQLEGDYIMSNTPSHIAYVVTQPRKGTDDKAFWRSVGSVWPHGKGDGFDLVIVDQLAVSGRITCRAVKDKPVEQQDVE
jgi:hypothetical protein